MLAVSDGIALVGWERQGLPVPGEASCTEGYDEARSGFSWLLVEAAESASVVRTDSFPMGDWERLGGAVCVSD